MSDDLQLLRQFRAEIPAPSAKARSQAYADATNAPPRRIWQRRPALSAAVALGCVTIAVFVTAGFFAGGGPGLKTGKDSLQGESPQPTIQNPLLPPASQVTLAQASSAVGSALVLPSTPVVQPSDAGPVWVAGSGEAKTAAVTFPALGLIVEYLRPAPYADPQTGYEQMAQGLNASQVADLSGTPALVVQQDSDQTGANFGVVAFEVNGAEIRVMGHDDSSTLEQIAQSILSRSGS